MDTGMPKGLLRLIVYMTLLGWGCGCTFGKESFEHTVIGLRACPDDPFDNCVLRYAN
jgi:hypothetical protein